MAYKALYREYRPETFDEVVGQQYIVKTLQNAIKNNKLAHAYLFCGPRGTGKTTIAKILAKAVNCLDENRPCGKCDHCKAIAEGSYPDVIEIDAASNNSVDEVRNLIEKVRYAPLEGKYKVYIIDEVHMMTSSAFNALLKTLEEPPAHVIFILATTEVHKVLPTIISRCQRFDFNKVSDEDIQSKIKEILYKENLTCEPKVPSLIASLADGGVRDALGILDQTIAFAGNNLTEKDVRDVFGILSNEEIKNFLSIVNQSKVIDSLELLNQFDRRGIDLIRFNNTLIDVLKDLIIYKKTNNYEVLKILNEKEANQLSKVFNSNKAFDYIDIFMEASLNFKKVSSIKSYYELIILKLCDVKKDIESLNDTTNQNVNENVVEKEEVKEEKINVENTTIEETTVAEVPNISKFDSLDTKIEENNQKIDQNDDISTTNTQLNNNVNIVKFENEIDQNENKEQSIPTQKKEEIVNNVNITTDLVIKYFCNCDRESRIVLQNIWPSIKRYITIPKYEEAAKALRDAGVVAAGPNVIVVTVDFQHQADKINSYSLYFKCRELLAEIFDNKQYYLIAITQQFFDKIKLDYKERRMNNSLPSDVEIKDLYTKEQVEFLEEKELESDENLEIGKEIFGDMLEVK